MLLYWYNKLNYVFREKAIDILDNISKILENVEEVSESGKNVELSSPSELDVVSITQLTHGRIKALDVYEGSDQFLCAAGAENGEIGLWIGNNKTVRMRIHNSAVNDVKLGSMTKLWTTSNDGFVKVRYNFTRVDVFTESFHALRRNRNKIFT